MANLVINKLLLPDLKQIDDDHYTLLIMHGQRFYNVRAYACNDNREKGCPRNLASKSRTFLVAKR